MFTPKLQGIGTRVVLETVDNTVKPVLRDHCHERPPVFTDHTFLAQGTKFQHN